MGTRQGAGIFVFLATFATLGCGGGQYNSESDWTTEGRDTLEGADIHELTGAAPAANASFDWVGVRHDLILSPKFPRTARCNCLAVEVGRPFDAKFAWEGTAPPVSSDKMAIAISALGIECPGGPDDERVRRPSISAIQERGDDIIVLVEEVALDRPLASGAIFDRPFREGGVFVQPSSKGVPYARPPQGQVAACRVY